MAGVSVRDAALAEAINGFAVQVPEAVRDSARPNNCGPIAFAFALYLRASNLHSGLIHVTGVPSGRRPGTGHYLATSDQMVVDFTFRQFDPSAPVPVLYDRSRLTGTPGRWWPWTGVSGELEWDDPLYPDFVEYDGNGPVAALRYVPEHLADPQWVTPWDDR